ncbi:hypothetical protein [Streptomyces sp. NPDC005438]|uniref:SCO4225 family membrane protein n=1 Tax=Streptomyces sp. NPDC005438 TaxID=3156880 RepID=UPI0033A06B43
MRSVMSAMWDNWLSRTYLALVAASVLFVVWDTLYVEHEDASLAGVWPLLATAPTSVALLRALPDSPAGYYVLVPLAAGLNALVLGHLVRLSRQGRYERLNLD